MTRPVAYTVLTTMLVVAIAVGARMLRRSTTLNPGALVNWSGKHAPTGVRIKVEVVNTTHVRGLGRRATRLLRGNGFDVVSYATGPAQLESTLVLDRSGHPEWALLIAAALGNARAESRPDTSRYVDATVLLGASWRVPPQPLDP